MRTHAHTHAKLMWISRWYVDLVPLTFIHKQGQKQWKEQKEEESWIAVWLGYKYSQWGLCLIKIIRSTQSTEANSACLWHWRGGLSACQCVCVYDGDRERQRERKAECALRKIPSGVSSACRDEAWIFYLTRVSSKGERQKSKKKKKHYGF